MYVQRQAPRAPKASLLSSTSRLHILSGSNRQSYSHALTFILLLTFIFIPMYWVSFPPPTPPTARAMPEVPESLPLSVNDQSVKSTLKEVIHKFTDSALEVEIKSLPWGDGIAIRGSLSSPELLIGAGIKTISICHNEWNGIRSATNAIYDVENLVLEMPGIVSNEHEARVLKFIGANAENVVIHGIPPRTPELAKAIKDKYPHINVFFSYHGASSNIVHHWEADLVKKLLVGVLEGYVDRIGFVKAGLAHSIAGFGIGIAVSTLWNFPVVPTSIPHNRFSFQSTSEVSTFKGSSSRNELPRIVRHIGVLGTGTAAKNVATQILAVCNLPNVVIHTIKQPPPGYSYLSLCKAPVIEYDFMPHANFVALLSRMDLNLYISLTECFPMAILESIGAGVPCLTSPTSKIFSIDPVLEETLVVREFDNPLAVQLHVLKALADIDSLSFRVKGLVPWLFRRAVQSWHDFLDLKKTIPIPSVSLQVDDVDTELHGLMEISALPYNPWRLSDAKAAPAKRSEPIQSIAVYTYELAPVNPGGAGVVNAALIFDLLYNNMDVYVLCYMPKWEVDQWVSFVRATITPDIYQRLHAFHVPTLLLNNNATELPRGNIFLQRSIEFARAASFVYRKHKFDAIEVFDYAGIGYELLRARYITKNTDSPPLLDYIGDTEYLPSTVQVMVRLHGTIELISAWEGLEVSPDQHMMRMYERFVLETADILYPQSESMKLYFSNIYVLDPNRMIVAPPPMKRTLVSLRSTKQPDRPQNPSEEALFSVASKCRAPNCKVILVYGKLQLIKGTDTIAEAISMISNAQASASSIIPPVKTRYKIVFVGLDMPCPFDNNKPMSACITSKLGTSDIEFIPFIARERLAWLVDTLEPHAAIIASRFETFNMAAHELSYLGVPLLYSSIPTLNEFFRAEKLTREPISYNSKGNIDFIVGNSTDLALKLSYALNNDRASVPEVVFATRYVSSVSPYSSTVSESVATANIEKDLALDMAYLA